MNVIKEINQINQLELRNGSVNTSASWHTKYSHSAWVYVGNLPTQLSEGDIISVMSQYGEIEDFNLVRDESNHNKSKGFAFVKYEDARSCILAVDNFNGSKVLGRSMRVDHVENYRLPKEIREKEEEGEVDIGRDDGVLKAGHAYKGKEMKNSYGIHEGQDLFAPTPPAAAAEDVQQDDLNEDEDVINKREEKMARKMERAKKRREKELRKEQREELRRLKRVKKLKKEERQKHSKERKHDKKRGQGRDKYDSDDECEQNKRYTRGRYDSDNSSAGSDGDKRRTRRRHDSDNSDDNSNRKKRRHRKRYDSDDDSNSRNHNRKHQRQKYNSGDDSSSQNKKRHRKRHDSDDDSSDNKKYRRQRYDSDDN